MPEGDTIWRAATAMRTVLLGRTVTGFRSTLPSITVAARRLRLSGSSILAVEAKGKHLLVRFGPPEAAARAVLHTHMGMHGSWHLYNAGSRWRRPPETARVVIEAGEVTAVCFAPPQVELLSAAEEREHPRLTALGPDVVAPAFDAAAAVARLRDRPDVDIAVALLDQQALAGIGNVYKSEVLFLRSIDPFAAVRTLDDAALAALVDTARHQLRRNLTTSSRRTTSDSDRESLWVYGRARRPCRRCGTTIRRALQGAQQRSTYWCPGCQGTGTHGFSFSSEPKRAAPLSAPMATVSVAQSKFPLAREKRLSGGPKLRS